VLTALIEEACVQETLAALQAGEEARRCEVPEVRDVLTQIAADEQRHAELGWRTLAWMLEAFPELRPVAITCLNDALDRAVSELPAPGLHAPADGVLGGRAVAALRRKAIAQVLRPCVDALASGSVVLAA
jgi:hypothetical protein